MITLTGDVNLARSEKFKSILGETIRFVVVGLVSFFVDYVFFLILNRLIFNQTGDSHTVLTSFANAIAYCVGVIVNYFLIRWFVFTADYQKENGKGAKAFILFVISSIIGLIPSSIRRSEANNPAGPAPTTIAHLQFETSRYSLLSKASS